MSNFRLPLFRQRALLASAALIASVGCGGAVAGGDGPGGRRATSSNVAGSGSHVSLAGSASRVSSAGSTVAYSQGSGGSEASSAGCVPAAHKVDLLFDIDNSPSMGDKQEYLVQAIPDLVNRLLNPDCVDAAGNLVSASNGGACPVGSQLEFPPVTDLHIGVVTSALGPRLSPPNTAAYNQLCDPNAMAGAPGQPFGAVSAHNDDQGHLIARSLTYNTATTDATEGVVTHAVVASYGPGPGGFLYWYPSSNAAPPAGPVAPETSASQLIGDFAAMVQGAGIWGCGIESQLESWYRFLVQPDPYAQLQPTFQSTIGPADMWVGVDWEIIRERHDFLRPDSLVGVIVLTDENDSEIDVRSLGGQGYYFMDAAFHPPKGTSACSSNPGDPACQSCSDPGAANDPANGPACASPSQYTAPNDWGYDPNLRHVHMKAKYGLDPQYPIGRYVLGLKSPNVPDRFGEYQDATGNPTPKYSGNPDCTNPLYATNLPDGSDQTADICHLQAGERTPDRVFFTIIGGVPYQLLHFDPNSAANSALTGADWVRILGQGPGSQQPTDPPSYDYTGIDPHMIEDYRDRSTVVYPFPTDSSQTNPVVPADSRLTDPVNGREWVTDLPAPTTPVTPGAHVYNVDLQYACTFPLATPRDCTAVANANACDCPLEAGGLSPDQLPPVCNRTNPTQQIAAKAYPTIRELMVAHMMGAQGIVSSICPIDVNDNATGDDPLYGYRPATKQLVDHFRAPLGAVGCAPGQGVQP